MIERKFLGHIKAHYSFPEYRKVVSYIAQIPHAMDIFKKLDKYFIIETDDKVLASIEVINSHKAFLIREVWNVLKNAGYLIDYDDENEKLFIYVYPAYYLEEHAPKTNKKLKGEKIRKETIRKMGKCFKFSPYTTVRMEEYNMTSQKGQNITVELEAKNTTTKAKVTGLLTTDRNGDVKIKLHNRRSVENLKDAADKLDFIYEAFEQDNESNKER